MYKFFICWLILCLIHNGQFHDHSHEAPSLKYSKEGNIKHAHSHGGSHAHSDNEPHHAHTHDEPGEAPAFKYSREANEDLNHVHSHDQPHKHHDDTHHKSPKHVTADQSTWLNAMLSTLLISAAPFFILFLVPIQNAEQSQPLLKVLLAFASGGLLGDAFLHLIPHATINVQGGEDHKHSHSHQHHHSHDEGSHGHDISVGLWVLAGIVTFLIVEKFVRIMKGNHGHSHKQVKVDDKSSDKSKVDKKNHKSEDKSVKKTKENKDQPKEIKVSGYLNVAADFSHNFTDGLAIGSSYLAGNTIGIVTTVTILLHEVPHEIGDFAILLQSGVSRRNAMLLQLSTALGALAGTAIALLAQDASGLIATNWVLPFTAGGFIYIALVSVIPELLEEEKPSIKQTFFQVVAMLGGVYMMVLIAEYE